MVSFVVCCLILISCQTQPIKGIPRPKVPICLIDVEDFSRAICGFGSDEREEDFSIDSRDLIGTTGQGYQDSESYVNQLENRIRQYQRRCKKSL